MNWTQGKLSYYADFALVPLLVLLSAPLTRGWGPVALMPLGYLLWTFSEYAMHRWIFHRVMRKQHWIHHIRPTGYIAVSGLWSAGIHGALMAAAYFSGLLGLFIGYELGYLLYIFTHDRIHHMNHGRRIGSDLNSSGHWWLLDRAVLHDVHHYGVEANFGVVHSWWDRALRTYCPPGEAAAWLTLQRKRAP